MKNTAAKDEQKHAELLALGREMRERREGLIREYRNQHPLPSRGRIITPELKELEVEEKRRFTELCDKYKAAQQKAVNRKNTQQAGNQVRTSEPGNGVL